VDSAGGGETTGLALDATGHPHVSYYGSEPQGGLKYAYYDGSAWLTQTVESGWNVGKFTSLALDAASPPITFTWDNGTVGSSAAYIWSVTGTYTVVVTATNGAGQGIGCATVEVMPEWPFQTYLPLVVKAYAPVLRIRP
jgi:hypothetical protein